MTNPKEERENFMTKAQGVKKMCSHCGYAWKYEGGRYRCPKGHSDSYEVPPAPAQTSWETHDWPPGMTLEDELNEAKRQS